MSSSFIQKFESIYKQKKTITNQSCLLIKNKHILKKVAMELNYMVLVILTVIGIGIPMCVVCYLLCYLLQPKEFLAMTPTEKSVDVRKLYFSYEKKLY